MTAFIVIGLAVPALVLLAIVTTGSEAHVINEAARVDQLHIDEFDPDEYYRNGITGGSK